MNLESLRQLPPAELSARALVACLGWRWMRARGDNLCAILPPEPADWNSTGWQPSPWGPDWWQPVEGVPPAEERYHRWERGACVLVLKNGDVNSGMPRPAERIEDAWMLEEAIEKAGRQDAYVYNLANVVPQVADPHRWSLWGIVHASPLDRTLAAILAMEGQPDAR